MVRGFSFTAVALLAWPTMACAQTAVLFPVGGDAELAAAYGTEARGHVERVLEEAAFGVLTGDALVAATVTASAETCGEPSCAAPLLIALHADIGVGVALWRRNGAVQVSVVLVDPRGVQVSADADGTESVVGQATESALAQARARWATRGGAPIRIVGSPEGASIVVDRDPWGTLPHEGTLSPGTHQLVVSADGYATQRRDVEVVSGTEPVTLEIALVSTTSPIARPAGPDGALIGIGGGASMGGIALSIGGIVTATGSERCVSGCDGPVADRIVAVPSTELGIGLAVGGGVALAVGVVLIVIGATAGDPRAVALGPEGLSVRF
jgi:hypothetical protein